MKIKSKIYTGRNGKAVKKGDIIDLDDKTAKEWVKLGYGEIVEQPKPQPASEEKSKQGR